MVNMIIDLTQTCTSRRRGEKEKRQPSLIINDFRGNGGDPTMGLEDIHHLNFIQNHKIFISACAPYLRRGASLIWEPGRNSVVYLSRRQNSWGGGGGGGGVYLLNVWGIAFQLQKMQLNSLSLDEITLTAPQYHRRTSFPLMT